MELSLKRRQSLSVSHNHAAAVGRAEALVVRHNMLTDRHGTGSLGHRVNGSFGSSFQSGSPGLRVIFVTR